jgi:hypothetical protein
MSFDPTIGGAPYKLRAKAETAAVASVAVEESRRTEGPGEADEARGARAEKSGTSNEEHCRRLASARRSFGGTDTKARSEP